MLLLVSNGSLTGRTTWKELVCLHSFLDGFFGREKTWHESAFL